MHDLAQLEIFVHVVADGGFTSAAHSLGVSKSFVSRQLGALEDRLGARLLNRTTRKLTLTDVGTAFYEQCRRILDELAEAEAAVTNLQTAPRGTLRVAAPMSFGFRYVAPEVSQFLADHDELSIDLDLADRRVDLLDEGFDLAIRIGKLADSSLIARKLGASNLLMVASREYLDRRGRPEHPRELREHDCLLYAYSPTNSSWQLDGEGGSISVPVTGRVSANNGDAIAVAARAGLGIARLPDFIAAPLVHEGAVEQVLPRWTESYGIWAVYPHNRHLSAKVRLFVEFLAERWATPPWSCGGAPARPKPKRVAR
ncbi:MAG: LysR family transcriptional regulator [Deltaproteobacteria bacterium]|nr:LysR family transcriptional regulator [Nannocystaceae bacterium]